LDAAGALAVTYVANSSGDFGDLVADDSIYYPRFARIRLER